MRLASACREKYSFKADIPQNSFEDISRHLRG